MDPINGTLNRLGFLFWNCICFGLLVAFGAVIDTTKASHVGDYWLPLRIAFIIVFVLLSALVFCRRLQNVGLSPWLTLIYFVPGAGSMLWLALFFLRPADSK